MWIGVLINYYALHNARVDTPGFVFRKNSNRILRWAKILRWFPRLLIFTRIFLTTSIRNGPRTPPYPSVCVCVPCIPSLKIRLVARYVRRHGRCLPWIWRDIWMFCTVWMLASVARMLFTKSLRAPWSDDAYLLFPPESSNVPALLRCPDPWPPSFRCVDCDGFQILVKSRTLSRFQNPPSRFVCSPTS